MAVNGAIRALNPATGHAVWQHFFKDDLFLGTPTLNGSGVLAAATYNQATGASNQLYLLDRTNGNILGTVSTGNSKEFAQPVFADNYLIASTTGKGMFVYTA
jgi:outer membrane protein assembly factor BamB